MIDFTHGMSLHDHAKKNQYFIKNTSTQVVLDKHAGALLPLYILVGIIPHGWKKDLARLSP
jgi:hypothetical protein